MSVLKVSGLTKNFGGLSAVSNVNMEIEQGELIGLIGPNGAGKTTLLQIIGTLDKPDAGQVVIDGVDVFALKEKELAERRQSTTQDRLLYVLLVRLFNSNRPFSGSWVRQLLRIGFGLHDPRWERLKVA